MELAEANLGEEPGAFAWVFITSKYLQLNYTLNNMNNPIVSRRPQHNRLLNRQSGVQTAPSINSKLYCSILAQAQLVMTEAIVTHLIWYVRHQTL